uniref:Upstream transcription factor 1 n=1 Tax=Panthera leo TaxID=9689 RepID=A0A8C9D8H1_PANLE
MKGQQKTAEAEEGTVQIQEGAVATGEDPTSVAIASIQSAATFPDPNVKYVFRTENGGQVMYRVIQVSEGQLDGQTEGTGAISGYPATQSMTQAVIQGAFTSDDTVDAEGTAAETHYTYFPSTAVGDGAAGTTSGSAAAVVTTQGSEALLGQATPPGTGQFFVMMSPQEVLQGGSQRSIAPRTHPYSPKSEAPRTTRDEKRRAQHNEGGYCLVASGTAWCLSERAWGVGQGRGWGWGRFSQSRLDLRSAPQSNAAAETRSTIGLCSCPRSSQTAPWRAPSLARSREGPGSGPDAWVLSPGIACRNGGEGTRGRNPCFSLSEVPRVLVKGYPAVLRGKRGPGCVCALGRPGREHLSPHFVGFFLQSKGGILSKACDYIQELRQSNHRLSEELQGLDQLQLDNDVLRQQVRPLSSVQPSSTPGPPSQFGTPSFGFHRAGLILFPSLVDA